MSSGHAQIGPPSGSGDHPKFFLRLETDADRKVYACFKTRPGWEYHMESASDLSKRSDPQDPDSQEGWTADGLAVYGGGQEVRTHIYTHPPPGESPPPVAPDPRPFYYFQITHFQNHAGSLISWGSGAARRSYLSALSFRSTIGALYDIDSVYLHEEGRQNRIGILSWGQLPYSSALEALPTLDPITNQPLSDIAAIAESAHDDIVAKLNELAANRALLSQQASSLPATPGIKKFFRAVAVEVDTDGDGLFDHVEIDHGLNPFLTDTDGDGVSDLEELQKGSDPRNPNSTPASDAVASNEPYWEVKGKFVYGGWYASTSEPGTGFFSTSAAGPSTPLPLGEDVSAINQTFNGFSYGYWRKWKESDGVIDAEATYYAQVNSNSILGHHRQVRLFRPQAENNAVGRTALWIKEYENPIASPPTETSTEAEEFKIETDKTTSEEIEMKPTFVALQKQKEKLQPVEFVQPKLDQYGARELDAEGKDTLVAVDRLRLCRWNQAFGWKISDGAGPSNFQMDFHRKDTDRFHIRINGENPGAKITLQTANLLQILKFETNWTPVTGDDADEITMSKPDPNKNEWLSEPLVLVDGEDDVSYKPGGTENQTDDPTHAAGLDSTIKVTIPQLNNVEVTAKTVTALYDIKVRNFVLSDQPLTQADRDKISAGFHVARDIYRPHRFTITYEGMPTFQNAEISSLIETTNDRSIIKLDTLAKLEKFGAAVKEVGGTPDQITVIWLRGVEIIHPRPQVGEHAVGLMGNFFDEQNKWFPWIAIEMVDFRPSVLAHEIGHAFGLYHTVNGSVAHLIMASASGPRNLVHHYSSDRKRFHFEESNADNDDAAYNEGARLLKNAKTLPFCTKLP